MITKRITAYLLFIISLILFNCSGQISPTPSENNYPHPERFSDAIQNFEAEDRNQPPPFNAVVCIGSSSMRGWHKDISDDLEPLTIIPRGFGGSNMQDALHYADRIVLPYKPRAIVIYEGDNDIAQGIPPNKIAAMFRLFVKKIHDELPECRIYFLSIKPSILRWKMWPKMMEANNLIATECANENLLTFVDVSSGMFNDNGYPKKDIFKEDNLHMTRTGYLIWKNALKPILLDAELQFEPEKNASATD